MSKLRPFVQVDVFTNEAYRGNPLAVVLEADGLRDEDMQRFARWTNLSETTFLLPPSPEAADLGADYRVRIFTPAEELPFAGHPTLGSCYAWLAAGGQPRAPDHIVQECAKGLVKLRRDAGRLAFAAPALERSVPDAGVVDRVATALGVTMKQVRAAQWLDNGPRWLGLLLDHSETVLGIEPDASALKFLVPGVGVAALNHPPKAPELIVRSNREARAFAAANSKERMLEVEADLEVRVFAPGLGVHEDPVTGSFHASLAQWLIAEGLIPRHYRAAQGRCMGRDGLVHIAQDDAGQVWVGGDVVTCISGSVIL
jgi:PhzF family phenazine biosynthesis protein